MSDTDNRFEYPLEFVKQHVLGCFEASKACALLPGKPHLYHVEFLQRQGLEAYGTAMPVDFHLQAHFSPCEEVSWYLHTREKEQTYEGSVTADDDFVEANQEGLIDRRENVRLADLLPEISFTHTNPDREVTVLPTPENYIDSMTDTFGCTACALPHRAFTHTKACKRRRSRFNKINKELNR